MKHFLCIAILLAFVLTTSLWTEQKELPCKRINTITDLKIKFNFVTIDNFTYDSKGSLIADSIYTSNKIYKNMFSYDSKQRLSKFENIELIGILWLPLSISYYYYNERGNISKICRSKFTSLEDSTVTTSYYIYDNQNRLLSNCTNQSTPGSPSFQKNSYIYDSLGRVSSLIMQNSTDSLNWTNYIKKDYSYSEFDKSDYNTFQETTNMGIIKHLLYGSMEFQYKYSAIINSSYTNGKWVQSKKTEYSYKNKQLYNCISYDLSNDWIQNSLIVLHYAKDLYLGKTSFFPDQSNPEATTDETITYSTIITSD